MRYSIAFLLVICQSIGCSDHARVAQAEATAKDAEARAAKAEAAWTIAAAEAKATKAELTKLKAQLGPILAFLEKPAPSSSTRRILVVARPQKNEKAPIFQDEDFAKAISTIPGVRVVVPVLVDVTTLSIDGVEQRGLTIQGIVPESPTSIDLKIVSGRALTRDDRKVILLGTLLAKSFGKKVGDFLEITNGKTHRVIGVFDSGNVFENAGLVMPLKDLQEIMNLSGKVSTFEAFLDPKLDRTDFDKVRSDIEKLRPGRIDVFSAASYAFEK